MKVLKTAADIVRELLRVEYLNPHNSRSGVPCLPKIGPLKSRAIHELPETLEGYEAFVKEAIRETAEYYKVDFDTDSTLVWLGKHIHDHTGRYHWKIISALLDLYHRDMMDEQHLATAFIRAKNNVRIARCTVEYFDKLTPRRPEFLVGLLSLQPAGLLLSTFNHGAGMRFSGRPFLCHAHWS